MTVRLATPTDAPQIAAIYAPFCESTVVSFEFVAPTPQEMAARIETVTRQYPWLALEDRGRVVGYAYATIHRERAAYAWSVDTAVYVAADARRRGVARTLYVKLFDVLVAQGYFKAYAGVSLPNPASVALHEALGFTPVGVYRGVGFKLGAWHDVAWYQRALQPERLNPELARPVSAVVHLL
jgi:L-amino acid N-acyltransferase YncA